MEGTRCVEGTNVARFCEGKECGCGQYFCQEVLGQRVEGTVMRVFEKVECTFVDRTSTLRRAC